MEPDNRALDIEFQSSITVQSGTDKMSLVAMVTYNAQLATKAEQLDKGSIVIVSEDGERLSIPYIADVKQG